MLPASEPESSSTFASGSPSRSIVEALHIAVAAIVNTNAIRTAMILRLVIGPTPLHRTENVNEVKGRRSKNGDKKCREKKTGERKQQFDRRFLRFLLGALASLRSE